MDLTFQPYVWHGDGSAPYHPSRVFLQLLGKGEELRWIESKRVFHSGKTGKLPFLAKFRLRSNHWCMQSSSSHRDILKFVEPSLHLGWSPGPEEAQRGGEVCRRGHPAKYHKHSGAVWTKKVAGEISRIELNVLNVCEIRGSRSSSRRVAKELCSRCSVDITCGSSVCQVNES